jgi:sodium/potassium-transporting ATPase subunit alpha
MPATYPKFAEWKFPVSGFTFVGMISLIDPPRDSVPLSVHRCKTAGIKVIMVTGDHPETACAIAKQVNIIDNGAITNLDIEEESHCSKDEAITRASAIVIHGD